MKIKWKKNDRLKPQVLMDKLKLITTVSPEGQVSYKSFEKQEIDSVVLTMIDFGSDLSYSTMRKIYLEAQAACAKGLAFTKDNFLSELNAAAVRHLARREKNFVMVTSVSIYGGFPAKIVNTGKAVVRCFASGLPKKYSGRSEHDLPNSFDPMPTHYCPVTVTIKSKDKMDAFHSAIFELDYIRGIHALLINPHSELNLGQGAERSLNRVMLGGMHSLHDERGRLLDKDLYWFEKNYKPRGRTTVKRTSFIYDKTKLVMKKMALHSEGYKIKSAIVRYVRAFDEVDRNVVIQKLWSALESIVSPNENNADSMVRRCSFMFAERPYYAQVLEHLREYRNRNVHVGHEIEDLDYHCYQLQMFFKEAVFFYLSNYKIFPSLILANRFLDLPSGYEELMHLKMSVGKALRYQRYFDVED